jgi:hypothetical protein
MHTARHPGAGRDPAAGAAGFRDHRAPTLLDSGLRRNDGEGDEQRGKHGAAQPRWSEPSAATCDTHAQPSVIGDGAVWPKVEQEEPRLFQNPSTDRACRVGGLDRPFLLVPSLDSGLPALRPSGRLRRSPPLPAVAWASKEKELGRRQASESPPQASKLATQSRAAQDPPLIPTFSPEGRRSQEQRPVAGEPPRDHTKEVRRTPKRPGPTLGDRTPARAKATMQATGCPTGFEWPGRRVGRGLTRGKASSASAGFIPDSSGRRPG